MAYFAFFHQDRFVFVSKHIFLVFIAFKMSSQQTNKDKPRANNILSSKDDELDLLGDNVKSFTGFNADIESAADNLLYPPYLAFATPPPRVERKTTAARFTKFAGYLHWG